jgi:hypothetical protein
MSQILGCNLYLDPDLDPVPLVDAGVSPSPDAPVGPLPVDAGAGCQTPADLWGEITQPADASTGVATDVEIRYRFSQWDYPVSKYNFLQDEYGQWPDIVSSRVDGPYRATIYALQPDTGYSFDLGWFCNFGQPDEERISIARVEFRTAP